MRPANHRRSLGVELLEDRTMPAVTGGVLPPLRPPPPPPDVTVANGVLTVRGTPGADTINISATTAEIVVTYNRVPVRKPIAGVSRIDVLAGLGNDTISITRLPPGVTARVDGGGASAALGGVDQLTGPYGHTAWTIDGQDRGVCTAPYRIEFERIGRLNTTLGSDIFTFVNPTARPGLSGGINAGTGADALDFSAFGSQDPVRVALAAGTGNWAGRDWFGLTGFEHVRGGAGNDTLFGTGSSNILVGMGGDDLLLGDAGNDLLIGGTGADTLHGGFNADLLIGGTTAYDMNNSRLYTLSNLWAAGARTYADRVARVESLSLGLRPGTTVFSDGARDTLDGNGRPVPVMPPPAPVNSGSSSRGGSRSGVAVLPGLLPFPRPVVENLYFVDSSDAPPLLIAGETVRVTP